MVLDCFSKKAMWCKMRRGLCTALIDAKLANIGGLGQNRVLIKTGPSTGQGQGRELKEQ